MPQRRFRWLRWLLAGLVVCVICVGIGVVALKNYATPTQRQDVASPLYTIGDENYVTALDEGKNIVKLGRLPFGIYPGGIAFENPRDAQQHLNQIGKQEIWGVYQLSGDYDLDTTEVDGQRYTNTSLLVVRRADTADAPLQR